MAETKNIYDQLADIQNQLDLMKTKPHVSQEEIDKKTPEIIEFTKKARRVWRFVGEKSEFQRKISYLKQQGVTKLVILLIQLALPFLMLEAPYALILIGINTTVCGLSIAYVIYNHFKRRSYEIAYDQLPIWGSKVDYDDNGIICSLSDALWLKVIQVFGILLAIISFVFCLLSLAYVKKTLTLVALFGSFVLVAVRSRMTRLKGAVPQYLLYFVDDKNDIAYFSLKQLMEKNNLK